MFPRQHLGLIFNRLNYLPFTISLFALEFRFALVYVSIQSFFRIFRLKQLLFQLALQREGRFERNLPTSLYTALDSADRAGSLVWRCEPPCILRDLLHKIVASFRVEKR